MDYTVSDLTKLLEVLNTLHESGVQVKHEINSTLAAIMLCIGGKPQSKPENTTYRGAVTFQKASISTTTN